MPSLKKLQKHVLSVFIRNVPDHYRSAAIRLNFANINDICTRFLGSDGTPITLRTSWKWKKLIICRARLQRKRNRWNWVRIDGRKGSWTRKRTVKTRIDGIILMRWHWSVWLRRSGRACLWRNWSVSLWNRVRTVLSFFSNDSHARTDYLI